jgi:chemotaxis protein methyltransferase CheR
MTFAGHMTSSEIEGLEPLEVDLLLEGVARRYGADLRGYARGPLGRRVRALAAAEGVGTISAYQERVLRDGPTLGRLLAALAENEGGMFRDPGFFLQLRRQIVPLLRTYPFVRIWLAGCATGEEVYSTAILLSEEGLTSRVRIYATDMAESVLSRARAGVYAAASLPTFEARYLKAGGRRTLREYLTLNGDQMVVAPGLRANVVFGQHSLATDRSFNEFNLVLCRNVLIQFGPVLARRVHDLFFESLCRLGVLALGPRESLRGSGHEGDYEPLDLEHRLFRRVV